MKTGNLVSAGTAGVPRSLDQVLLEGGARLAGFAMEGQQSLGQGCVPESFLAQQRGQRVEQGLELVGVMHGQHDMSNATTWVSRAFEAARAPDRVGSYTRLPWSWW